MVQLGTVTPIILDVLKANDVKATFFVLGSRVDLNPDILRREYDEGHYIANHGYSHNYKQIYSSVETVFQEFIQTENSIKNALQNSAYNSHLFRFPGGSVGGIYASLKSQAITYLEQNEIAHVDWNCLNRDAEGNFSNEELINNVIQTSIDKNSVVVLMHDAGTKYQTAETLQDVINYFRDNGYKFMNFYDIFK